MKISQTFKTEQVSTFHAMVALAIKEGLTFEAYEDSQGMLIIEYLGGY